MYSFAYSGYVYGTSVITRNIFQIVWKHTVLGFLIEVTGVISSHPDRST